MPRLEPTEELQQYSADLRRRIIAAFRVLEDKNTDRGAFAWFGRKIGRRRQELYGPLNGRQRLGSAAEAMLRELERQASEKQAR